MAYHYARQSGIYELLERIQIHTVEFGGIVVDGRKCLVGVVVGIAVSGKVLADSHDSAAFNAARVGETEFRNTLGILAERAEAYDRILRIGVDVENRCEVDLNAE